MKKISICLIGIDGSGKTSNAKFLVNYFKKRRYNVRYIHYTSPTLNLVKKLINKVIGHNKTNLNLYSKSHEAKKGNILLMYGILALTVIDEIISSIKMIKIREKIIIRDRCFYDYLIEFCNFYPKWLLRFIVSIFSKPDILLWLNVSPKVAHNRKTEGPLHIFESRKKSFDKFFKEINFGNLVIIDADHKENKVNKDVIEKTTQKLSL